jgi:beta-galactosidase beta subunit
LFVVDGGVVSLISIPKLIELQDERRTDDAHAEYIDIHFVCSSKQQENKKKINKSRPGFIFS